MKFLDIKKSDYYSEELLLHSRKIGENGLDFIILHGLFGSGKNWSTFSASLKNNFQVWTIDARNHGLSPHSNSMGYPDMVEDIFRFCTINKLEKIILLGHSMGGKTAMNFAQKYPDMIAALIVVDIAPVFYDHELEQLGLIDTMKGLHLANYDTRMEIEKKLLIKIPNKRLVAFLMTNLINKNGQFMWRIGLEQIATRIHELLNYPKTKGTFKGPVKFIGGEKSEYLHYKYHKIVRKYFPESSITIIENCGHWLHVERPNAFKKTVNEFLFLNNFIHKI